jgi:predicted Zn-dependent protease with MMP-like domain
VVGAFVRCHGPFCDGWQGRVVVVAVLILLGSVEGRLIDEAETYMVEEACQRIEVFRRAFLDVGLNNSESGACLEEILSEEDLHDFAFHDVFRVALEA